MVKKDGRDKKKKNTRLNYCQVCCAHSCPCIFVTFLDKVFFSICSGKDSKPLTLITSVSMPLITLHPTKSIKSVMFLCLIKKHNLERSPLCSQLSTTSMPFLPLTGVYLSFLCGFLPLIISSSTHTIRCFQVWFPKTWH